MLTHSISDEIEQKIFGKWRRHFPIEQNEPEILPRPRFPPLHLLTNKLRNDVSVVNRDQQRMTCFIASTIKRPVAVYNNGFIAYVISLRFDYFFR